MKIYTTLNTFFRVTVPISTNPGTKHPCLIVSHVSEVAHGPSHLEYLSFNEIFSILHILNPSVNRSLCDQYYTGLRLRPWLIDKEPVTNRIDDMLSGEISRQLPVVAASITFLLNQLAGLHHIGKSGEWPLSASNFMYICVFYLSEIQYRTK